MCSRIEENLFLKHPAMMVTHSRLMVIKYYSSDWSLVATPFLVFLLTLKIATVARQKDHVLCRMCTYTHNGTQLHIIMLSCEMERS